MANLWQECTNETLQNTENVTAEIFIKFLHCKKLCNIKVCYQG